MAQYIDKEKLATKLSIYISNYKKMLGNMDRSNIGWADSIAILEGKIDVLQHILSLLDTLEVKESEKEFDNIEIRDFQDATKQDRIEVLFGKGERVVFPAIADLDHFIYQLRQASFDYKIGRSKQKPYEPRRGC